MLNSMIPCNLLYYNTYLQYTMTTKTAPFKIILSKGFYLSYFWKCFVIDMTEIIFGRKFTNKIAKMQEKSNE